MAKIEILNAVLEAPARPRDCALLVSVPTTREEFFHDCNSGADFVETYTRQSRGTTPNDGWEAYQPYASLARHVIARAKKYGVTVFERATLDQLHRVLPAYAVTTLVAHWRSARFRPPDIVDCVKVSAYLAGLTTDPGNRSYERKQICSALNSILDEGRTAILSNQPMSHGGLSAQQFRWYEKRATIEATLPGSLRGGAAVEFCGGFRTISEITGGISPDYSGTLDLTVCQSVLLGELVKRRCQKALVLTTAETTSMDFRFALYHQVIEILARSPRPFEDAVIDVRKAFILRYGKPKE